MIASTELGQAQAYPWRLSGMKFLFLPPQTDVTRSWAEELRHEVPELEVVVAENPVEAAHLIEDADGAFGTLPADLLAHARKLRWLQAPFAAPPAGYYHGGSHRASSRGDQHARAFQRSCRHACHGFRPVLRPRISALCSAPAEALLVAAAGGGARGSFARGDSANRRGRRDRSGDRPFAVDLWTK